MAPYVAATLSAHQASGQAWEGLTLLQKEKKDVRDLEDIAWALVCFIVHYMQL